MHIGKDGAPQGRPCLSFDDALVIVAELMPVEAKHPKPTHPMLLVKPSLQASVCR
jgi:hypothetical protein